MPDVLPDPLRLLLVGINPSLWSAAAQAHFARPGNRFWPALHAAGITARLVDVSAGMSPEAMAELERAGVGITNLVRRATARADELSAEELTAGADRLRTLVARKRPAVVAILGITAYRLAFGRGSATRGVVAEPFEGARLVVAPNPSGLNAHENLESLATAYRTIADLAGVPRTTESGGCAS